MRHPKPSQQQIHNTNNTFTQNETTREDNDRRFRLLPVRGPVPVYEAADGAGEGEGGDVVHSCE